MKRLLCLEHVPFEGPGYFLKVFEEAGCRIERRLVPEAGLPREWPDAMLVMGGPMSVNDPDGWILKEREFIREATARGVPCLGVCLGSQFLAKAIGGSVTAGPAQEIGMTNIRLTEAAHHDPVFRKLPPDFQAFAWHGEGVHLPPDATVLATSTLYPVQAFRHGRCAYGLLFHVEIEAAGVDALCQHGEADLARARVTQADVEVDAAPHLPALNMLARHIGHAFADLIT